ncbi:MAG TPA: cysteine desulfurase [Myxococcaceae bacterium]|nr:cysteine desulfurase [Myxococcaceae bacterium]
MNGVDLPVVSHAPQRGGGFDVERVRADFPALQQTVYGRPLVYLDSAATSQKPRAVIDAISRFYERDNANVHRGIHRLSERATAGFEGAREKVRAFLHAAEASEIVFVRGTTEAINLVAHSYVAPRLSAGDEILITAMEHHSNIVPWQLACDARGARLRVAPVNQRGELVLEELDAAIGPRTRLVSVAHVSNALGTVNPVERIVELAHRKGVPVLVDGAQAAPHLEIDVSALGCDFYAFSAHKAFGPTGIGVLYGRRELLEEMGPYQGGGEMILSVSFERTVYNRVPHRFEAGTPDVAGAVGLGAAIDYLAGLDREAVRRHEDEVISFATEELRRIPGLSLVGTPSVRAGAVSFMLDGAHPHDVGTVLDREGVAVRTGHHCAQPLMERLGLQATVRASFALYNTRAEVESLVRALLRAREVLG